jgi:hypothetical protein
MKWLKFVVAVTIITLSGFVLCESAKAENSIGFAAGTTRGMGVTYRALPDKGDESRIGWQVTGLPFVTPESGFVSGGVAVIYVLDRGRHGLLYASLGAGGLRAWENCNEDSWDDCEEETHWGIGVGPGIGFELRFWDNFGLSLDVPLAFLYGDNKFQGVYPVPNTGLVYNW